MIRCVRIWTGADGDSHFAIGEIVLGAAERGDALSVAAASTAIAFRETPAGGAFAWHEAPHRQLVITLSGSLEFETRSGARVSVEPGDVLLAEDTAGSGHRWRLRGEVPWRRAYVVLAPGAAVPFRTP